MNPYIMSQMHLGTFSLTHLEQHCARRTDIHELDVFCVQDRLICRVMGHLLHGEQYLLDKASLSDPGLKSNDGYAIFWHFHT